MKIAFTGGGSGGHFYPTIAVAQEVNAIALEQKLLSPKLFYIGPEPYDSKALYENNVVFKQSPAGKMRRYFSILNIFDLVKTFIGIIKSIYQLYFIYPDVVFSKGGYASFPTLVAARILRIPVVIHESDAVPGRVNKWAGKFAKRIAISYPEAASYFDQERVALTGNPIRKELYNIAPTGGKSFLDLEQNIPTIAIFGGSQGAERINDMILDALPDLVDRYQVIHQTGDKHLAPMKRTVEVILKDHPKKLRYKPYAFLDPLSLRMAAGASDLIITRAGSGMLFEIALWGAPSIVIPIPEDVSRDQRKNAFSYARTGAAVVIEEANLTPHLLVSEVNRLISDKELRKRMGEAAKQFSKPHAAHIIAEEVVRLARLHELDK